MVKVWHVVMARSDGKNKHIFIVRK